MAKELALGVIIVLGLTLIPRINRELGTLGRCWIAMGAAVICLLEVFATVSLLDLVWGRGRVASCLSIPTKVCVLLVILLSGGYVVPRASVRTGRRSQDVEGDLDGHRGCGDGCDDAG